MPLYAPSRHLRRKARAKPLAPEKETLPPPKAPEALGKEAKVDGGKPIVQGIVEFEAKDGKIKKGTPNQGIHIKTIPKEE